MTKETVKVEVLNVKPTHIELKFLTNNHITKMGKQFFRRRLDAGVYEVINPKALPSNSIQLTHSRKNVNVREIGTLTFLLLTNPKIISKFKYYIC